MEVGQNYITIDVDREGRHVSIHARAVNGTAEPIALSMHRTYAASLGAMLIAAAKTDGDENTYRATVRGTLGLCEE